MDKSKGVQITIDTDKTHKFLDEMRADGRCAVDVSITIDGVTKEMTLEEFSKSVGIWK